MLAFFNANPNDPGVIFWIAQYGSAQAYVNAIFPPMSWKQATRLAFQSFGYEWSHIHTIFAIVAWPWLTFGTLMIFRQSMRRAKVKTSHVMRCVIYGFDWGFWLTPAVLLTISDQWTSGWVGLHDTASLPIVASILFAAYGTYRLGSAYALYLRFDNPYATAAISQGIVLLIISIVAIN
jgi:hypothetical protein